MIGRPGGQPRPEHAWLRDSGRAEYRSATDDEALQALLDLCRLEGILPALESAHALAALPGLLAELGPEAVIVLCLSGRGDKDVPLVRERLRAE